VFNVFHGKYEAILGLIASRL